MPMYFYYPVPIFLGGIKERVKKEEEEQEEIVVEKNTKFYKTVKE